MFGESITKGYLNILFNNAVFNFVKYLSQSLQIKACDQLIFGKTTPLQLHF